MADATRTFAAAAAPALEQRFYEGMLLGGRYRVLDVLGSGGMGQVYKAYDTKLDQVVALKFLPESLRGNAKALVRLHTEVRVARQVSHPNVCRVYDAGEEGSLHFLAMEYIDGEDLAHFLKRVGRFPQDKGVEIARKLCLALAAAHNRQVLHRDLKPANVMLTAAGEPVIVDFGLAGVAEELRGDSSGTPAYMAPEQIQRGEASARSDIYSLGLVLYEILTGKRAFDGAGRGPVANPSSIVQDLDPAVERAILSCISEDPAQRPATALALASSLPGGDPLQVALAAGETPSPEMVAGAPVQSGIGVRAATLCLAGVVLCLFLAAYIQQFSSLATVAAPDLTPEAMAAKARDIASSLGYTERPLDTAYKFEPDTPYLAQLKTKREWERIRERRPAPYRFWYRESRWWLGPVGTDGVRFDDPPHNLPGMISMYLDTRGRLELFQAIPPARQTVAQHADPDWNALFAAAGLDRAKFEETDPEWWPLISSDMRRAWKGTWPGQPESPIRIEAAGLGGRPVYFRIVSPWMTTAPAQTPGRANLLQLALGRMMRAVVFWLAWRNLRAGRGDRRGAFRVGACVFALRLVYLFAIGDFDHAFTLRGRGDPMTVGWAFYSGFLAWAAYMALEPLVRRKWPQSLVSWSRLLAGRYRDPLLGRDLLIGVFAGAGALAVMSSAALVVKATTGALTRPVVGLTSGTAKFAEVLSNGFITVLDWTLLEAVLFVICWILMRKKWAAALLTWAFMTVYFNNMTAPSQFFWIYLPMMAAGMAVLVGVLARFGLTAAMASFVTCGVLALVRPGLDFSAWDQNIPHALMAVMIGLALFGYRTALAGRAVISRDF